MKATIDEMGKLTVTAEEPIESYALSQWVEHHTDFGCDGDHCTSILQIIAVEENPN